MLRTHTMKQIVPYLSSLLFSTLLLLNSCDSDNPKAAGSLLCYVGGTMRPAMEEIADMYKKKTNQEVLIDYAGSGELLVKMEQTQKGDLYVAHDPFLAAVMNKNIAVNGWVVAGVEPTIVVAKGNPKKITGLEDLGREGVAVVLTDANYSTMGHLVPRMAKKKDGLWKRIQKNVVSRTRGGGAAANAVSVGTADAAIVWNAVAHLRSDKLDAVEVEPDLKLQSGIDAVTTATYGKMDMGFIQVTMATLKYSKYPAESKKFAEYVASSEASKIWMKHGFLPPPQNATGELHKSSQSASPLFVHCAAGMRKPVSSLAKKYETATGTKVELSFDGSNRLLGQIRLTQRGDMYIAGDADYIDMAEKEGLVFSRNTLCTFIPVILVQKNNPKNIEGLAGLLASGTKIGQGDPKAAAVGRLTPKILSMNKIDLQKWNKNVAVSTPTVNELGVAIKLGTLDAAIVWDCIARQYKDVGEIVTIPENKNITPRVEAAVLTVSNQKDAANGFLRYLVSDEAVAVLHDFGYTVNQKVALTNAETK